jgi:hypothetical protein
MNSKGIFWAVALLLCFASVNGRKMLEVQVTVRAGAQASLLHCCCHASWTTLLYDMRSQI